MESSQALIASAVHESPALSGRGLLERLFSFVFHGFVYNQIWEDPRVDAIALKLTAESRILTIASGGCNMLNYLQHDPAAITAVDMNAAHMHLTRLKLCAVGHLPTYEDLFAFFGCADDPQNMGRYQQYLRPHLDAATRHHWEGGAVRKSMRRQRIRYFERNLYDYSTMGIFLQIMHKLARHKQIDPGQLLSATSSAQQELIFERDIAPFFDSKITKGLSKLPFLLYALGVPPRQYETFKRDATNGCLLSEYRKRVKRLACDFPVDENYFAWQAFTRRYDRYQRRAVPDYLKECNYELIKSRLGRIDTHLTSMTGFLVGQRDQSLDRFVLLDAQDWMTDAQITALWRQIARVGRPGTRIIFRTGAAASPIETVLPPDLRQRFVYEEELSRELFTQDRAAIYGGFHVYAMP